jgi:hypothetical protein
MPTTIQEQYDELIRCAEKYIRSPHRSRASAVLRWRGKTMRWLKANVPRSGLALKFTTTANPADDAYARGVTKRTVASVQQGLKILQDAEALVPVLKNSRGAKVTPETMRKVFIVHGHDELMKQATARFVTKLGLEPVIPTDAELLRELLLALLPRLRQRAEPWSGTQSKLTLTGATTGQENLGNIIQQLGEAYRVEFTQLLKSMPLDSIRFHIRQVVPASLRTVPVKATESVTTDEAVRLDQGTNQAVTAEVRHANTQPSETEAVVADHMEISS